MIVVSSTCIQIAGTAWTQFDHGQSPWVQRWAALWQDSTLPAVGSPRVTILLLVLGIDLSDHQPTYLLPHLTRLLADLHVEVLS